MRKAGLFLTGLVIIGLSASLGLADGSHPMNVHVSNDLLWLNVSGNPSTTLTTDELTSGISEKALTGSVQLIVGSFTNSCTVFASAPDFGTGFPINHLQLQVSSSSSFRTLANIPVAIANFPRTLIIVNSINFKLVNLQNLQASAGNYHTIVTYTAVSPAIGQ